MLGSHSIGREAKRNINDIRMDFYISTQNLQLSQREIFLLLKNFMELKEKLELFKLAVLKKK